MFTKFLKEFCPIQLTNFLEILYFWKYYSQTCLNVAHQPDDVHSRVAYRWNKNFVSFSTVCVKSFYLDYWTHGGKILYWTFFCTHSKREIGCLHLVGPVHFLLQISEDKLPKQALLPVIMTFLDSSWLRSLFCSCGVNYLMHEKRTLHRLPPCGGFCLMSTLLQKHQ